MPDKLMRRGRNSSVSGYRKVIRALLEEGHFVMVVTNGSVTNVLKKITEFPQELLKRLIFKFSYHYLEHHRMNLTELFLVI